MSSSTSNQPSTLPASCKSGSETSLEPSATPGMNRRQKYALGGSLSLNAVIVSVLGITFGYGGTPSEIEQPSQPLNVSAESHLSIEAGAEARRREAVSRRRSPTAIDLLNADTCRMRKLIEEEHGHATKSAPNKIQDAGPLSQEHAPAASWFASHSAARALRIRQVAGSDIRRPKRHVANDEAAPMGRSILLHRKRGRHN